MSYKQVNISQMSFASYDVDRRTSKNKFFKEIDTLIDWLPIERELKKVVRSEKKDCMPSCRLPLFSTVLN